MKEYETIPHDQNLDNSVALMREGFLFIKNRMEKYNTNIFEARILGKKIICISGEEATKLFYDTNRFQRKGSAPYRIQQSIFGVAAIQTLDGEEHLRRKQLFLSHMTVDHQKKLAIQFRNELKKAIPNWQQKEQIVLFDEIKELLCKIACEWTSVPIEDNEINERAEDFIAMIYAFGAVGPEHWKGRRARNKCEDWLVGVVSKVRDGKLNPPKDSVLYTFSFYKDSEGNLLSNRMAAIEIINVLRPIVAIATYITFSALALHTYPRFKEELQNDANEKLEAFVEEVRRFYPFGPFLGARVKQNFVWKNYEFTEGTLVFLDIFGTNHDEKVWKHPNQFYPSHFHDRIENHYNFIPQGGGDPSIGHRCAGEGITVEIMKETVDFLVNDIDYQVPAQDLNYSLDEMPTLPKSGFIMEKITSK